MKAGLAVVEALRAEEWITRSAWRGPTTNSIITEMHGRSDIPASSTPGAAAGR